ncbi:beta-lactamase family protein [Belliella sp. R4-6]|uniref:Beta-lactamase family protein n=1 Tax=Belliella alkalica TaxID=1730871 RepID=A0ABS9VEW2_9BACT|nr:serine hydrolase domain-containing protein [Belliella alkalica]MCH7414986.1 beta-lactamase family protein [Belliella alkalica]
MIEIKKIVPNLLLAVLLLFSCKETENNSNNELYFPPIGPDEWETISPASLNWKTEELDDLFEVLEEGNTRGFIILKDGKIVIEKYFGNRLIGSQSFDKNSSWYWASAGKILTATLVGIAQEEELLSILDPSSKYLGDAWTSLNPDQEKKITIWHQLTMTSGLDESVNGSDDYSPEKLLFKAEPGTRWAYHNAPYTILDQVIEKASGKSFDSYFDSKIASKIGMRGSWQRIGVNNVYFSDTRSAARFGLLVLADGKWKGESIIDDKDFLNQMTTTSQTINESYGYLWWLNGKRSYMIPSLQIILPGPILPNAPEDMISGLGKDGQFVCVVPSKNLVLIRFGMDADNSLVSFQFLDLIWEKINNITGN